MHQGLSGWQFGQSLRATSQSQWWQASNHLQRWDQALLGLRYRASRLVHE